MIQRPAERAWVRRTIAVVLFVGTVLLFSRTLGNDFVNYDDPDYVTSNAHVKAGLSASSLTWALRSTEASNWHPLTWVSHMVDWSLFGPNPRGHHATNVLLHALTAVLVFEVFRRMTAALWTSALLAALFAWHPLRVESVAWVAERKDVLSGLFWFAALWAYVEYVGRTRRAAAGMGKRAGRFYGLALSAFALGLMAKPMLVTFPCVLLLLDVWPLRRYGGPGSKAGGVSALTLGLEKLPFFALAIGSSIATYLAQKAGGSVAIALGLEARLANAIVAVVRYLGKFFWPVDLAVLYPHPGAWPAPTVAGCALVLLAVSALAWRQRRNQPWIGIGWLWFLGTLVPVIGLVQVGLQSIADRYTYLPIVGVQIALLWTLREAVLAPGARRAWIAVGAGLLAACGVLTWVGSSRVDLQACKLEYSIVSPK